MDTAPIALFTYNRPEHTRRTIEALRLNPEAAHSDLVIFSDAPKHSGHQTAVDEVRAYLQGVDGFRSVSIVRQERNQGLARSIIDGVTSILSQRDRIIVLEDDLVTSPYFLRFMNEALVRYSGHDSVASIHGYLYPFARPPRETFFLLGADCWGWATWRNKWAMFEPDGTKLQAEILRRNLSKRFDVNGAYPYMWLLRKQIEGKNDSWAIRWQASAFLNDQLTLYPTTSLVMNIGMDDTGTHSVASGVYDTPLATAPIRLHDGPVAESAEMLRELEQYYRRFMPGRAKRALIGLASRLKQILGASKPAARTSIPPL